MTIFLTLNPFKTCPGLLRMSSGVLYPRPNFETSSSSYRACSHVTERPSPS